MHNEFLSPQAPLEWQKPICMEVSGESGSNELHDFIKKNNVVNYYDPMGSAVDELYDIVYPHEKDIPKNNKSNYEDFARQHEWPNGTFVYFPWNQVLIRFPYKKELRALRTSRNRNLITAEEQNKLYKSTILVAGLSVGSNIVEALVSMGIGGKFICADMDTIEPSNLNRIRAPYHHVGSYKTDSIAIRMNEIDPYLDFVLLQDGVNDKNLTELLDTYKPAVVVDEMDQVQLKIRLRNESKARGIPVVSAADNGDSALLDIERYDTDPDYPILHGLIPDEVLAYLQTTTDIPRQQLGLLIGKYFVGSQNIPLRMYQSLTEVGRSLPSWPQLGGAATQSGVAVAYACRQIILGQPLSQGRFVIGPDQVLNPDITNEGPSPELLGFQKNLDDFKLF